MVTSLKNLKTEIDDRLAEGGLTSLACCQLQNAETLANNVVYSVANTASLPDNLANEGRLVYVEDIKEYRLANDVSWTDDVSSGICVYQTQIWSWGQNTCGQLGHGTVTSRCSPVREFCSATDWCQASAGCDITGAIKTSGELWVWGSNRYSALGDGGSISAHRCSPVREFCSATDWCQVGAGCLQMSAIKTSGELWSSGIYAGDGTKIIGRSSPVREICSATDWCQVTKHVSEFITAALKTSGELWVWGRNTCGQLGDGTTTARCSPVREFCSATDWCSLSAGFRNNGGVKTSGQIWVWGPGSCGMRGDGTTTSFVCSPVREICSATDWCYLSIGVFNAAAIKTSGELWTWGKGLYLADGTTTDKCSPVREICSATDWCSLSAGRFAITAIKTSGELWVWGQNFCGALGDGTITTTCRCSPVREFCSATDWCQVSSGIHVVAIRTANKGFLE